MLQAPYPVFKIGLSHCIQLLETMPRSARRPQTGRQPPQKEGSKDAGHGQPERQLAEPRSGEGSDSALARLKDLERDRLQSEPDH